MLAPHWEFIDSGLNKTQGTFQMIMLEHFFIYIDFWSVQKKKNKIQQTFYVRFSTIHGSYFRRLLFLN